MFTHVLTLLLDATFSQLTDQKLRTEAYKIPSLSTAPIARIVDVSDQDPAVASTKLANILAVMTREAHKIGNGVPNEYVQAIEGIKELEAFAAVVYSSNFELEAGLEVGGTPQPGDMSGEDATSGKEKGFEAISGLGAEEDVRVEKGVGIIGRATGVFDAAWGRYESAWEKATGTGGNAMTG